MYARLLYKNVHNRLDCLIIELLKIMAVVELLNTCLAKKNKTPLSRSWGCSFLVSSHAKNFDVGSICYNEQQIDVRGLCFPQLIQTE